MAALFIIAARGTYRDIPLIIFYIEREESIIEAGLFFSLNA